MLTADQEKYLFTIPEDKIADIKAFDAKVRIVAEDIIKEIERDVPGLEIFFGGASALGIAGQNDIDINLLGNPDEYEKFTPSLIGLFGEPAKTSPTLVKWELVRGGFDVELYLTDRNSPVLQEQIKTFEILHSNPELKNEYEKIKISANGLSFREYMKRKYEFFNKILNIE